MAMVVLALGALPALAVVNGDTPYGAQGAHNKQVKQGDKKDNTGNQANSGVAKSPTPANAEYKKPCKHKKPHTKKLKKPKNGKKRHNHHNKHHNNCKKK